MSPLVVPDSPKKWGNAWQGSIVAVGVSKVYIFLDYICAPKMTADHIWICLPVEQLFVSVFRCKTLAFECMDQSACEAERTVAVIGSVLKCVAHCKQNESISVIAPIKCPNIFPDLPVGIGVFRQALSLRAKRAISDAYG